MRTSEQLVRVALGDPGFSAMLKIQHLCGSSFDVFDIELSLDRFRGLPPEWTFVVLRNGAATRDAVLQEARNLLAAPDTRSRVLMLSEVPRMRLGDEFDLVSRNVVCIDPPNLPETHEFKSDPRFSPFALALQRKGLRNLYSASDFMPYLRGKPARGWQFFGRKNELRQLCDTSENFAIVGARRLGKSSLMEEVKRRLDSRGESVYYVNVQHCRSASDAAGQILNALSPRERYRAVKHGEALSERPFAVAIKAMASARTRTTLLIDELGNVIANMPKDDWNVLGVLRGAGQGGNLRFIISCFQEMFIRQQKEFEGPLVNLANVMRLGVFTETEIDEFFLAPFEMWLGLKPEEKRTLGHLVHSVVGPHPYFLQYFCWHLFTRLSSGEAGGILETAKTVLRADLLKCFEAPQEEVFYHGMPPLLQYVFLTRCKEADDAAAELVRTIIDDDWLESLLKRCGFASSVASRRNILEGLEIRGLCVPADGGRSRQRIVAPIVYLYVKTAEQPLDVYIGKLLRDVKNDSSSWGLNPLAPAAQP